MDTLPSTKLWDYKRVKAAILQTLNLSPEAYRRQLCEIEFGPDYHHKLIGQKIKDACLQWLHPEVFTKEHYTAILLFKPPNWVLCHRTGTLEEAVCLMKCTLESS